MQFQGASNLESVEWGAYGGSEAIVRMKRYTRYSKTGSFLLQIMLIRWLIDLPLLRYNSHNYKFHPFKLHTSVVFSTFTELVFIFENSFVTSCSPLRTLPFLLFFYTRGATAYRWRVPILEQGCLDLNLSFHPLDGYVSLTSLSFHFLICKMRMTVKCWYMWNIQKLTWRSIIS